FSVNTSSACWPSTSGRTGPPVELPVRSQVVRERTRSDARRIGTVRRRNLGIGALGRRRADGTAGELRRAATGMRFRRLHLKPSMSEHVGQTLGGEEALPPLHQALRVGGRDPRARPLVQRTELHLELAEEEPAAPLLQSFLESLFFASGFDLTAPLF